MNALRSRTIVAVLFLLLGTVTGGQAQQKPAFRVIAFYTAKHDQAHISYVHEANAWFPQIAKQHHFAYDTTSNWNNLNTAFLGQYQVVLFLDTRPEEPAQRAAFQQYMEHGGAWMGFHFAGFALTPSSYPQNWDWYHNTFLGAGTYVGNTWRPTAAVLRVQERHHPATRHLPATFTSAPNEWYKWSNDLRTNPAITVLLAIDPQSFPLGTGPKPHEIWHSGYYPVAWTNHNFRMVYVNMGHNDIDYEHGTNKELSFTFQNKLQNQFILDALLWLGSSKKTRANRR
ncbi:ThuA domain-containing protein [Hymenobacter fodinae]|uniref:ThuA domain-containing protein n=1 Tax=Hymenobacter fodinae TaxID=2510796 RepID=A0A4Z0P456_9BACT|nr:ThuA domain-containing protein [Hymenobacter fodinae]TGE06342.1 ThuA domain-containing protein [Hymenobacter fodinae]